MTAVAVVVYYVGLRLKRRFNIFDQYCIPAPVIGGVLFSLSCSICSPKPVPRA